DFVKDAWALIFLDDPDQPGALAFHDFTPQGKPLGKVFVKSVLDNEDLVSVAASHQLVEMLIDPQLANVEVGPDRVRTLYACEVADPVESLTFHVDGVRMSDFVYPAYFAKSPEQRARFDHLGKVTEPFQVLSGGYQLVFRNGKWVEIFGSKA